MWIVDGDGLFLISFISSLSNKINNQSPRSDKTHKNKKTLYKKYIWKEAAVASTKIYPLTPLFIPILNLKLKNEKKTTTTTIP